MREAAAALLVALVCCEGGLRAGSFNSGGKAGTVAGFLEHGVDARAGAMGGAYSAVADQASAMYWNPAALARVERRSIVAMHESSLDSSFYEYGAYAQSLGRFGAWGASFQFYAPGSITQTDDATGRDVGRFSPYDAAYALGYAADLRGWSLGAAVKIVQSKILLTDQTAAADVGILSPEFLGERLRLALTAVNMGGRIKFEQESVDLPLSLRAGAAVRILPRWTAALDAVLPRDHGPFVSLGTEYRLAAGRTWSLAGRLGFNSRPVGDITGFAGATMGIGVASKALGVDYAFVPYGGVGNGHQISLCAKF